MTTDRVGRMIANMIASDIDQDGSIGDRDRPLWVKDTHRRTRKWDR
jgi:hypothetical protein